MSECDSSDHPVSGVVVVVIVVAVVVMNLFTFFYFSIQNAARIFSNLLGWTATEFVKSGCKSISHGIMSLFCNS